MVCWKDISHPIHDPILQFTLLATMALLVQLTVKRLHLPGLIGLILGTCLSGPLLCGCAGRRFAERRDAATEGRDFASDEKDSSLNVESPNSN